METQVDHSAAGPPAASALPRKALPFGGTNSIRYAALADPRLTAGARAVLLFLVERAGPSGRCWPSEADIGRGTVRSTRQVRRDLAMLAATNWISRVRRGRHPTTYEIRTPTSALSGPSDRTMVSGQGGFDRTSMSYQGDLDRTSMVIRPDIHGHSTGHRRPPNPRRRILKESSSPPFGISGNTTSATKTEDDIEKNEIEKLTDGKTIEEARQLLEDHSAMRVSRELAARVMHLVGGDPSLLRAYVEIAPRPRRGSGFYLSDIPRRLPDARRHLAEREAAERQAAAQPRVAPQPTPPPKACPTCDGTGYLMRWLSGSDAFEWCTCSAAERLRSQRPDLLERLAAESKQLHDAWRARATPAAEPRPPLRLVASRSAAVTRSDRIASRGGGGKFCQKSAWDRSPASRVHARN
jgi:hypothetical protein